MPKRKGERDNGKEAREKLLTGRRASRLRCLRAPALRRRRPGPPRRRRPGEARPWEQGQRRRCPTEQRLPRERPRAPAWKRALKRRSAGRGFGKEVRKKEGEWIFSSPRLPQLLVPLSRKTRRKNSKKNRGEHRRARPRSPRITTAQHPTDAPCASPRAKPTRFPRAPRPPRARPEGPR